MRNTNRRNIYQNDNFETYKGKSKLIDNAELPLPNINNLRKWINNKKKAS